jgi:hypothetical protein
MRKVITATLLVSTLALAGCAPQAIEAIDSQSPIASESVTESTVPESMPEEGSQAEADDLAVTGPTETGPATADQTAQLLTYLIEEEKLAHDVYTVLYETYGSRVFGNILESESTHQDQVAGLLTEFGISDPRSSEVGVFTDPELQALYDQLIAKGMLSATDAFEVGVIIEEKDIKDISDQLSSASEPSVIDVLERLRSGSENHLRAFNRQL